MQWDLFSSGTAVLVITAVEMVVAAKGVAVVVIVALVVVPAVVCNCCTCRHFRCVKEKIWPTLKNVIAGDFNADLLSYDRNGSKLKLLSMLLLEKPLIPIPSFLI